MVLVYELAAVHDERRKPELGTQSIRTAQVLLRHIRFPTGPYGQQEQMGSSTQRSLSVSSPRYTMKDGSQNYPKFGATQANKRLHYAYEAQAQHVFAIA